MLFLTHKIQLYYENYNCRTICKETETFIWYLRFLRFILQSLYVYQERGLSLIHISPEIITLRIQVTTLTASTEGRTYLDPGGAEELSLIHI